MKQVKSIGMFYEGGEEITLGDIAKLITGEVGEVVYECGAYGIAFNHIDYDKIQQAMDSYPHCCGNDYAGVRNDNFVSLWEIYWNFNCEENILFMIEKLGSESE